MLLEAAGAQLEPPPLHNGPSGTTNSFASSGGGNGTAAVPLRVGRYSPVVSHMLKADFG